MYKGILSDKELLNRIQERTFFKKEETDELLENVKRYLDDSDRKKRLLDCLCKHCYYLRGEVFACSAMTYSPCVSCGREMGFGSTDTDDLCYSCAEKYKVCRQCLADIDLKKRRKLCTSKKAI